MREHPDIHQLKRQAKELLQAFTTGDPDAAAEVNTHYRGADRGAFALHDAQLVLARSYGFDSWPKLKAYVDGITVQRLADFVRAGDLEQARSIIESRPELVNMTMSYGDEHRPLHFAVMGRLPAMVRLLMQHGADAREGIHPHRDATTALTLATERGYDEIVAIIREEEQRRRESGRQGIGATAQDERSGTMADDDAVGAVARSDEAWLLARHAEGKLVNRVTWESGGLLTVAVKQDRLAILRLLLDLVFDPNERATSGEGLHIAYSEGYPLWHAAALGRLEMAELLIRRGASLTAHVDSSGSAVYSAYSHRQWDMVELLKRHGGVVTPDIAGLYRETEVARRILAEAPRGTLQDAGRPVAEELLDYAASGGADEIVAMALECIDWKRDDPRWFRMLARTLDFWNHIPWLYAAHSEFDRSTYLHCLHLVLKRCDPNIIGGFGRTVLHEVAAMGDHVTDDEADAFAKGLLEAGARTDVRDEILQSTPLGWACRWGRAGVVREMLIRGADPVEADSEPWARPAAWGGKMGHPEVLAILREHSRSA